MTTTINGHSEEMVDSFSHCIVDCGWLELDGHGDYCERKVGSKATGVTEPGWSPTEVWCSVIRSYIRGTVPVSHLRDSGRHRTGVQATIQVRGEFTVDTDSESGWSKIRVNFTSAEARQLVAQLLAAADSHDHINQDAFVMRRLEKIAEHLGADIFGL